MSRDAGPTQRDTAPAKGPPGGAPDRAARAQPDRAGKAQPDRAQPLAREAVAARRLRDGAIAMPLAATLLFASPLLDVMGAAGTLWSVPAAIMYIFGTWFGLIWLTARLARRLTDDGQGI